MRKEKRIILVGKGASGKDFLAQALVQEGLKKNLSVTTRSARNTEEDGVDYHFISAEEFNNLKNIKGFFYENDNFNGWDYGTTTHGWKTSDVFIMTPAGVAAISPKERAECYIVYLDIPEDIRKARLSQRLDADTIGRRLKADETDFKDFTDFDLKITDQSTDIKTMARGIISQRRTLFIEHASNIGILTFAVAWLVVMPFIYQDYIKGIFPLNVVVFLGPLAMIGAIIYRWLKFK